MEEGVEEEEVDLDGEAEEGPTLAKIANPLEE